MSTSISQRQQLATGAAIKAPCAAATNVNCTLNGAQTVGGVSVGATMPATRVLCFGQSDATENGIYDVQNGAWTRSLDSCAVGDFITGTIGIITAGSYADEWWILTTPADSTGWIIPDSDPMTFQVGIPALPILGASTGTTLIGGSWFGGIVATVVQLASSIGSSLLGFIQAGANALAMSIQSKLRQSVNAADFTGYDPTGILDSTAAIIAAYTALGYSGGTINIGNADKVYIASNLTLPSNIHIKGPHLLVGTPGSNSSVPYASMGGSIYLAAAATITLGSNSGLSGLLIYPYGMTFPAPNSTSFAGTAITVGGDDCFVIGCMILGFAQAVYSSGFQRPRIYNCNMDNLAGIWIDNCTDIPYINKVHCWPFSTIPTGTSASALRSGSAFRFSTVCDWGKVTDCFSYGYAKGFWANGVNDMTFTNCSCDGTQTFTGSIGYAADAGGLRNKFIGGNVSSQDTAVYLGDTDGTYAETEFIGCHFTTCAVQGVNVQSSDATFTACVFDAVPYGIYVNDTASAVQVIGCRFSNISVVPIDGVSGCSKVRVSPNNDFGAFTGASPVIQGNLGLTTVASATPLAIPNNTHFFEVSGTTGFSSMQYGWVGREVTIVFSGILTVSEGSGVDSLNLASSASFTTGAGAAMKFIHNGTNWFELSRKS